MPPTGETLVRGTVRDEQGNGLVGVMVGVFLRESTLRERLVGTAAVTDQFGNYVITLLPGDWGRSRRDRGGRPFVRVSRGVVVLQDSKPQDLDAPEVILNFRIKLLEPPRLETGMRVYGAVHDPFGRLSADAKVEVYDVDLRAEEKLGESPVEEGRYEVRYTPEQFRRAEKSNADIVVKVLDGQGQQVHRSPAHFNAPDDLIVDIHLSRTGESGPSQWEDQNQALLPLLEGLSPLDLREEEEHQDLTFLAGESGYPMTAVGVWMMCYRLADTAARQDSPLTPELIFAFLSQGKPLLMTEELLLESQQPERMVLFENNLLRQIADLDTDQHRSVLMEAVGTNIVSAALLENIDEVLETLAVIRSHFTAQQSIGPGKGTVEQLLSITPEIADSHGFVLRRISKHTGPMDTLWVGLTEEHALSEAQVTQLKRTFTVAGLTRNHVPLVAELTEEVNSGRISSMRDLARRSTAEWKDVLRRQRPDGQVIGVPANIDGDDEDEKLEVFAKVLDRQFERRYPTSSFAAKLEQAENPPPHATKDVARFLTQNPEFHLDRFRVEHFTSQKVEALEDIEDPATMIADLKTVQRVFKLDRSFKAVDALLSHEMVSAQKIYFMGQTQLVEALKDSPVNAVEARRIYRKAENTYALALALFGDYNAAVNGVIPAAVPDLAPGKEAAAKVAVLPNLQTLFGSMDYCECRSCRSVYSAPAHLVDVLRFLGERSTHGTAHNAGKSVRQVLLERRPDLGDIELSCENTDTAVPYIDLVNEVLEDVVTPPTPTVLAVAEGELTAGPVSAMLRTALKDASVPVGPDAVLYPPDSRGKRSLRDTERAYNITVTQGVVSLLPSRQTYLSSAEVLANPEHTNADAYDTLASEVFPLRLPFDLWWLQTRTYLEHLGVPQPRLLEIFQQRAGDDVTLSPQPAEIDAAWLGFSDTQRQAVLGTLPGKSSWELWGLAENGNDIPHPETPLDSAANGTGTWLDVLRRVPFLLHRAGLTYAELLQVLDMRFVDPDGSVRIDDSADPSAVACDVRAYRVEGLTAAVADRLNRFLRLWRGLQATCWEVDLLLPDTNPDPDIVDKQLTEPVLQDIAVLDRLRQRTGLEWELLRSWYADFDTTAYADRRDASGAPKPSLYQRLFRNKLVDAIAAFPADPADITGTIDAAIPGILAATRLTEADLDRLLRDLGLTRETMLNEAVLAQLHRNASLPTALGMSVDDFCRLRRLSGNDPFAEPRVTLAFAELADRVTEANITVPELDYLLTHRSVSTSNIAMTDATIGQLLRNLREGLLRAVSETSLKAEQTPATYVQDSLAHLPGVVTDTDQALALALVDGTWAGPDSDRKALLERLFAGTETAAALEAALPAIPSGLSPADRQDVVDARFAFVQPLVQAYLIRIRRDAVLRQKAAEVANLPQAVADVLLEQIKLTDGTTTLRAALDDDRLTAQAADGGSVANLDEATFGAIFTTARLLHKAAIIIDRLNLSIPDVLWWVSDNRAAILGWLHPADLPTALTGTTNTSARTEAISIDKWEAMVQWANFRAALPADEQAVLAFQNHLTEAEATATAILAELADVTGWDRSDLDALVEAFHWRDDAGHDVVLARLRDAAGLTRLANCMRVLRRLGVTAARALGWARYQPRSVDAQSLKQTIKAKYDLTQWQQVIRPLHDTMREARRRALVDWLVMHPNRSVGQSWSDADGLYSHFLIDVEMGACMLTSRIVQATAAAQLFVQRCLLNLEQDIRADIDLDPKWKQWQWMKRYRVWEANRKVFLYPENWIEPELRDEKSPFFMDLEKELLQNDITKETVEAAYRTYLGKLTKVANLEVRTILDEPVSSDESVLHVVGRSRGAIGAEHYYRKQINHARWTPWERIDQEITGDHLVAGLQNRRLYLLWPQFLDKADPPSKVSTPNLGSTFDVPAPFRRWEMRLFWSELRQGGWTPKVLASTPLMVTQYDVGSDGLVNLSLRTRARPHIDVRAFSSPQSSWAQRTNQALSKVSEQIFLTSVFLPYEHIFSPEGMAYANGLLVPLKPELRFGFAASEPEKNGDYLPPHAGVDSVPVLGNVEPHRTYTVLDAQATNPVSRGGFFVFDMRRTYFVDYTWSSATTVSYTASGTATHTTTVDAAFRYFPHYHPYVELFTKELNIWGIKGLLNRRIQVAPNSLPNSPPAFDFASYQPSDRVLQPYPVEDVDFSYRGAYSPYNWELFFHVPMFIANSLATNQRFEEALEWFHYIFDPMSTDTSTPDPETPQQKFWMTKPFYETTRKDYHAAKIENMMVTIAKGDAELKAQVDEWRNHPFNPHLIARMRTVAYQKNVLIKYIRTLIAYGDALFTEDSRESLNEATQLYVLAHSILGPRPRSVPKLTPNPVKTYYQLEQEGIDTFGNVLIDIENLVSDTAPASSLAPDAPELPFMDLLYFGIPHNETLLEMWETVEDRLFKVRNCMNIEGVVRQLPLFSPPIDPAALVRAAAAGLNIGALLGETNAPQPHYRFEPTLQQARLVCDQVRNLGVELLSVLEKRDAEGLAVLHADAEKRALDQLRLLKQTIITETQRAEESLQEARKLVEERRNHFQRLLDDGWNKWEHAGLGLTTSAITLEEEGTNLNSIGSSMSLLPDLDAGVSGAGGSPTVKTKFGGTSIAHSLVNAGSVLKGFANAAQMGAGMTAAIGGYARRAEDWKLQHTLAVKELPQVDKQIAAAHERYLLALQDLNVQDVQIENNAKEREYLQSKFTDQELYSWLTSQIAAVYFPVYRLASDLAQRAERCFRYELGLTQSQYIGSNHWDSLRQGLLAGERLAADLSRLEAAYREQNRRAYELTKRVSLAQLDPAALLQLRQNGECLVSIPETVFDLDYPGHYFRRLRSVGLSIPCVVGPHTTIGCTLTLTGNQVRTDPGLLGGAYARNTDGDDPRFRDQVGAIQSVATSDAQDDHGLFELSFSDPRYLPFEGSGAVSTWHLRMNKAFSQFDLTTISDVVLTLRYTAREGGGRLAKACTDELAQQLHQMTLGADRKGLYRVLDLRREFPDAWYRFLHPADPTEDQVFQLPDLKKTLPFLTQHHFDTHKARTIEIVAQVKGDAYVVALSPLAETDTPELPLEPDTTYAGLSRASKDLTGTEVSLGPWTLKVRPKTVADFHSLPAADLEEIFLVLGYTVS